MSISEVESAHLLRIVGCSDHHADGLTFMLLAAKPCDDSHPKEYRIQSASSDGV